MSKPDREAMLDRDCIDLSMRRQCTLLRLARSGVYRRKAAPDPDDLAVMKRIDELYLAMPFYGSRKMVEALRAEGRLVNRKRVRRLMRLMGLVALAPKPGTSKASPQNKIYPYLLRGLTIEQPNHVWAADITYIPMAKGFLYPTRARSSPARPSRAGSRPPASASQWTGAVAGWTTFSSSGSGARSNTRRYISKHIRAAMRHGPASANG